MLTSCIKQSSESGYVGERSFDAFNFNKQQARDVSFEGCFTEDPSFLPENDTVNFQESSFWTGESYGPGILSSAVSQGGDIYSRVPNTTKVQEAYKDAKLTMKLRKCWNGISCIKKLRGQLNQTQSVDQLLEHWNELNLACRYLAVLDALKYEFEQMFKSIHQDQRLVSVMMEVKNSFELLISLKVEFQTNNKLFKQLQLIVDNLFIALYSQCILQNCRSTVYDDRFRCEKRFQIWNSLI